MKVVLIAEWDVPDESEGEVVYSRIQQALERWREMEDHADMVTAFIGPSAQKIHDVAHEVSND